MNLRIVTGFVACFGILGSGCVEPGWYYNAVFDEEQFAAQQAAAVSRLPEREPVRENLAPADSEDRLPTVDLSPFPFAVATPGGADACPPPVDSRLFDDEPFTWLLDDLPDGLGPLSVTIAEGRVTHLEDAIGDEREVSGGAICEDEDGRATTQFTSIAVFSEENPTPVQYTFELTLDRQASGSYLGRVVVTHLGRTIYTWQEITLARSGGGSGGGGGGYTYYYVIYY